MIGSVGSFSGAVGSSFIGAKLVLEGWAKQVNDSGGINGHPVQLIVRDDAGSPAQALAAVKKLVESDKVVAIVGDFSGPDETWAAYVEQKGIPVLGGNPAQKPQYSNADFFPVGGALPATIYGLVAIAAKLGPKTGLLYCAESPVCAQLGGLVKAYGAKLGVSLDVATSVSASAVDYTSQCEALKSARVNSYLPGLASTTALRVIQSCKSNGVTAAPIVGAGTPTNDWATTNGTDGTRGATQALNFFDTSTSAGRDYQALLSKYVPNIGNSNNANAILGYASGKLFEAAVKAGPSGTVTSQSILQGLYSLKNETLGGLTAPLTFTQGKPTLIPCYFPFAISGGKWTSPDGVTPVCVDPSALAVG